MNIRELLKNGTALLGPKDTALLECEILLCLVLGVEKEYLIMNPDEEVDEVDEIMFFAYVQRVRNGEPVEHITNQKEFYGLDFFVDNRVLIPRPETEMLVEKVLEFLREGRSLGSSGFRLIDVGTGSGNISVSIAKTFLDDGGQIAMFEAVDVSEEALEVAKLNRDQHGLEHVVQIYQSDLLEGVDDGGEFDVIVANLPYIGEVKNRFVSREAEEFEPNVALFGGDNGLELYKKMFQQITDKNVKFKLLLGEFGFAQTEDMEGLLSNYFDHYSIEKDLAGIDRIFIVTS